MKRPLNELDPGRLLVAPSILAADFAALGSEICRVEEAGCDLLHLDVMDGHFVPNLTIGPPIISSIRKVSSLSFDTHLMISNPLKHVEAFAKAGADHITFHIESDDDPSDVIDMIESFGCSAGLCVKPGTSPETILPFLDRVAMILVMTVEPGFGGQSFMPDMIQKVSFIRSAAKGLRLHIEVDGGLDSTTVSQAASAGANVIVAGTSVFRNPKGAQAAIDELHSAQKLLPKK